MRHRPRLVWMMTPEPLMTRRNVEAVAVASAARTDVTAVTSSNDSPACRSRSRCPIKATFTRVRPNSAISGTKAALERIRSTDGMLRRDVESRRCAYCIRWHVINRDDELDKLEEDIRKLFNQIENEHRKLGKNPTLTFEQLRNMVEKQSEQVRTRYNVNVVGFRVDVVDGKVKLKANPIQE